MFTKVDKRKSGGPGPIENIEEFQRQLTADWETLPVCFATSAQLGDGREELLKYLTLLHHTFNDDIRYITQLTKLFKKSGYLKRGMGGRYTDYDLNRIRDNAK